MKAMRIKNFTPHSINIISNESVTFDSKIRKYVSDNPIIIFTFESYGILNCTYKISHDWLKTIDNTIIPVRNKLLDSIDPIPIDCDVAIVSGLYASATNDSRAYTVIDPVFDSTGLKVIGCLAIGKVYNN